LQTVEKAVEAQGMYCQLMIRGVDAESGITHTLRAHTG
jgi:hypothetical protein